MKDAIVEFILIVIAVVVGVWIYSLISSRFA